MSVIHFATKRFPRVAWLWAATGFLAMVSTRTTGSRAQVVTREQMAQAPALVSEPSERPITTSSLSVVLPAYNEEANIEKTLTKAHRVLSSWLDDFELIVVNDGSKDRTAELVEQFSRRDARIRLVTHEANRGYGAALVTGFQAITKDLVFFMDSDGQFDISDLAKFFPLIEHYDAVFGYRNPRCDPWIRLCNAWGWKQLGRLCFGLRVRDVDCAFKLYRAEFFQTLELETRGAMINTEMLYKFKRAGLTFTEVGVRHLPREKGEATGAKLSVIVKAFRELIHYARKWRSEEREAVRGKGLNG